jgi:predicted HTH domain antitoxin
MCQRDDNDGAILTADPSRFEQMETDIGALRAVYIPDDFSIDDKEARLILAAKLYERGKLSLGQPATLSGYSKETFMELLADYDVDLINHDPDDPDSDLANAERHSI